MREGFSGLQTKNGKPPYFDITSKKSFIDEITYRFVGKLQLIE